MHAELSSFIAYGPTFFLELLKGGMGSLGFRGGMKMGVNGVGITAFRAPDRP